MRKIGRLILSSMYEGYFGDDKYLDSKKTIVYVKNGENIEPEYEYLNTISVYDIKTVPIVNQQSGGFNFNIGLDKTIKTEVFYFKLEKTEAEIRDEKLDILLKN